MRALACFRDARLRARYFAIVFVSLEDATL
jgi:hypothetical protein